MNSKYTPSDCLTDVVVGINEQRDMTRQTMMLHYGSSSEWLAQAIQTCKRKILEGTGLEVSEPKRMKPMIRSEKGNISASPQSVMGVKKSKKAVLATTKKEVPANVRSAVPSTAAKATARSAESNPHFLRVVSLKVAELRAELSRHGLEVTGLKKELQTRLLDELAKSESKSTGEKKNALEKSAASEENKHVPKVDRSADDAINDATRDSAGHTDVEMQEDDAAPAKITNASRPNVEMKAATSDIVDIDRDAAKKVPKKNLKETTVTKSFFKTTAEIFSPSKVSSSMLQSLKQERKETGAAAPVETTHRIGPTSPRRNSLAESLKKAASVILSASPVGKPKAIQPSKSPFPKSRTVQVPVEGQQAVTEVARSAQTSMPSNSNSDPPNQQPHKVPSKPVPSVQNAVGAATKEKRNQVTAARMARLAEMRGKSKPVAGVMPAANDVSAISASKNLNFASAAKDGKGDRKAALAAKMREKAAAGLKPQLASGPFSIAKKITATPQIEAQIQSVPAIASPPKAAGFVKKQDRSTPSAFSKSAAKLQAKSSSKKLTVRPDLLSPMSTYEISDREQSDTDDSDSECGAEKKKKKKVPRWAQRSNLLPALENQYANSDGRLDPEVIFPPVATCNLEDIFDQKKSRYKKRTSSANWSRDGVTVNEIVAYKRTMGY